ncbi:MAG: c-type cytochrome [Limisphaerales bacterium]
MLPTFERSRNKSVFGLASESSRLDRHWEATNSMKQTIFVLTAIVIASAGVGVAADVSTTWAQNCASCHGKDGSGNTMMGKKLGVKDYHDAKVQAAFSDAEVERAIKEGVKTNGKETMKPFGNKLSDADIKALVAYIRSFKK